MCMLQPRRRFEMGTWSRLFLLLVKPPSPLRRYVKRLFHTVNAPRMYCCFSVTWMNQEVESTGEVYMYV